MNWRIAEWHVEDVEFERKDPNEEPPYSISSGIDELKQFREKEEEGQLSPLVYKVVKDTVLFRIEIYWNITPQSDEIDFEELESWEDHIEDIEKAFGIFLSTRGSHIACTYLSHMGFEPMQGILEEPEYLPDEPVEETQEK